MGNGDDLGSMRFANFFFLNLKSHVGTSLSLFCAILFFLKNMLLYFFICVWIVYVPVHTCMTECMCITRRASVEVRGQPYGLCSLTM